MQRKDENQIAFSTLLQATLTDPMPGKTPGMRSWKAHSLHREQSNPGQARQNGIIGAAARWGTQEERDNPHMKKRQHLDISQLAKRILEEATGELPKTQAPPPVAPKNKAAVALGKLGGKRGGAARAASLTPEQRADIAKKAAAARWGAGGKE